MATLITVVFFLLVCSVVNSLTPTPTPGGGFSSATWVFDSNTANAGESCDTVCGKIQQPCNWQNFASFPDQLLQYCSNPTLDDQGRVTDCSAAFAQAPSGLHDDNGNVVAGYQTTYARNVAAAYDINNCYDSSGQAVTPTTISDLSKCWTGASYSSDGQTSFTALDFSIGSDFYDPSFLFYTDGAKNAEWYYNSGDHIPFCNYTAKNGDTSFTRLCACGSFTPPPPTETPTTAPTTAPTVAPTGAPIIAPTAYPTHPKPTHRPTPKFTGKPTTVPTSQSPSTSPTVNHPAILLEQLREKIADQQDKKTFLAEKLRSVKAEEKKDNVVKANKEAVQENKRVFGIKDEDNNFLVERLARLKSKLDHN